MAYPDPDSHDRPKHAAPDRGPDTDPDLGPDTDPDLGPDTDPEVGPPNAVPPTEPQAEPGTELDTEPTDEHELEPPVERAIELDTEATAEHELDTEATAEHELELAAEHLPEPDPGELVPELEPEVALAAELDQADLANSPVEGVAPTPEEGAAAGVRECARCGSGLPQGDEGLCPTCGMPFGFRTRQMPTLTPQVLSQHGYSSYDHTVPAEPGRRPLGGPAIVGSSEGQQRSAPPIRARLVTPEPPVAPTRARAAAVAVLLLVLVLLVVLLVLLAR
jgi:hypothetical protein